MGEVGGAAGPAKTGGPGLLLMTANAYLLPSLFVNQANATCVRQHGRAVGIGRVVTAVGADVVCLQEMWGSNTAGVARHLEATHYIPWRFRPTLPVGVVGRSVGLARLATAVDTVKFRALATGGLFFACRKGLPVIREWAHTFATSASWAAKGIFAALVDVRARGPTAGLPPFLLVVTTHLDPGHSADLRRCQRAQLAEVATFVARCAAEAGATARAAHPGGGAVGVVCCGDWNCDPAGFGCPDGDVVYPEIARALGTEVVDLADELGHPGATYDAGNRLAQWSSGAERLDLVYNVRRLAEVGAAPLPPVWASVAAVLRQPQGAEVSDHWPLVVRLQGGGRDARGVAAVAAAAAADLQARADAAVAAVELQ
mmetsp:Transcript_30319/g.79573  ORF Transcript_30319/g.79573 Transcript_30319/m.79573 type:complete len:371 (-) Transcript_30319:135-1247(-)